MSKQTDVEKNAKISWLDILVLAAWLQGGLLYFIPITFGVVLGSRLIGDVLMVAFYLLLIFLASPDLSKRIRASDLLFAFALTLILVVSYLLQEDVRLFIEEKWISLLFNVLPYYFIGVVMNKDQKTFDLLYYGSLVAFLVNLLYIAVILGSGREMQEDNLFLAYSVLPHALMVLWRAFEKKKIYHILFSVFAFLLVLSLGSRGPVVSFIVFLVLILVYRSKGKTTAQIFLFLAGIFAFWFVMYSDVWEDFLIWLRDVIDNFNISTRVIDAVLEGAADGSNEARFKIYGTMLDFIQERPLIGYGIYGEWPFISYYAHQVVLELWCHYGVLLGSGFLIAGIATFTRGFRAALCDHQKIFVLLMVCWGVVRCMYTGTYLSEYIFLFIGFSIGLIRDNKQKMRCQNGKACNRMCGV